jgi:hypothetical protein
MKKKLVLIFCFAFGNLLCQNKIDFDKHIESIEKEVFISEILKGEKNVNKRSVDYALQYLRKNGIKKKYIMDRRLLRKIDLIECKDSSHIYFSEKLDVNLNIDVKIYFKKLDSEEQSSIGDKLDTLYYGLPVLAIDCIKIEVNGKSIKIPKIVYKKFFEVSQCKRVLFYQPIEVYSSNDGEYIFIYMRGGSAAGSYLAKLIFNQKSYITEIVASYRNLREWGAFRNRNFLGF